ncbi:MAG: glycoside hydrolase family 130 protein [Planctomycetota bacterium]|jgi:beta-1,4-mannooligosaccharide/beta-1,4-mannosyl-N-acetylglucosamine phosphorylase
MEPWSTSPVVRHPANPVLAARDVPYPATLVFNAGVAKWRGRYAMVFRNDFGDEAARRLDGTNIGLAWSDDGISWEVAPEPCFEMRTDEIRRAYDPRLTVVEDRAYMCFAVDTSHGIRGGIAVTDDFERFEILSLSVPDNRNMVLFPERIAGRYARLERPFPVYGRGAPEAFDIWFSDSPDMCYWGNSELVLGSERVPWANLKAGPPAPPVRTDAGWLAIFHAVDVEEGRVLKGWEPDWRKRYTAGAMLLDLDEPWRVIGMTRAPLLEPEPEYAYEVDGFRGSVIFPTGAVLEPDGELKIYYGASDTAIALATARVDDVLTLCEPVG